MLYEIINPSDPYTFNADDVAIARFVVLALGSGQYDGEDEQGNSIGAMMLFMDEDETKAKLNEFFGGHGLAVFRDQHREEIIAALESVMIYNRSERAAYDEAVKIMTPDQVAEYRLKVHDKNRSSLNDIGSRAWKYAADLRKGSTVVPPRAPRQVYTKRS
jgi:hypothetical protein